MQNITRHEKLASALYKFGAAATFALALIAVSTSPKQMEAHQFPSGALAAESHPAAAGEQPQARSDWVPTADESNHHQ